MRTILARKRTWLLLALFSSILAIGWCVRSPVLSWYYVRELTVACQENRDERAIRVAALDAAALPLVLHSLHSRDALICANMQQALWQLARRWGPVDPRTQQMLEQLHAQFDEFEPAGQEKIVQLLTDLLRHDTPRPLPPRLTSVVSGILVNAEKHDELRALSLLLAAELIDCVQPGQWVDGCREMTERGIRDEHAATRVAAAQLLMRGPMRTDDALIEKAIPLLRDPEMPVRRAGLLVLASETGRVREEVFLHLLHDEAGEVRELCETALRKRGLTDKDIRMARMISAADPVMRMQVLEDLKQMPEANLHEWLRRLSIDPEPAVRASAVRAAGENPDVDFFERLREMAAQDPNDAVRQNAQYYLQQRALRAVRD